MPGWSTAAARSPLSRSTSPRTSSDRATPPSSPRADGHGVGLVDVGASGEQVAHLGLDPGPAQQQVDPPGGGRAGDQAQRLAVEPLGDGQGLRHLGPAGRLLEPVERQRGDRGRDPLDRPQLGGQLGGGAVVEGHHVDQAGVGLAAVLDGAGEVVGDAVVAAGPVGLGQDAVGDLADEIGAERPVVAVDPQDLLVAPARPAPRPGRSCPASRGAITSSALSGPL